MRMMNEELPYEQQMMPILKKYDKLVEENRMLKRQIKGLEKTAEYERNAAKKKLDRIQKTLEDYLVSLGIELPRNKTITKIVEMITKI